ncbi:MAG: hypothetical protein PVJ34_15255 [Anaerolineae bacterium]|jgi:hypothetical protein
MILPFEREQLTIVTSLSPEQARQKLLDIVESKHRAEDHVAPPKRYKGKVYITEFEIMRRTSGYRNPFLPLISIEIMPNELGASVGVTLGPQLATEMVTRAVLGLSVLVFLLVLANWLFSGAGLQSLPWGVLLISGSVFAVGRATAPMSFSLETRIDKRYLQELFRTGSVSSASPKSG